MKNIKYTNEIDIVKIRKNTLIKRTRKFLKKNKIFIIVIPSFFLTVMSVIVSSFGVITSIKSTEIYDKQLEILENDREPYFLIKSELVDGIYQGRDYDYTKKLCTIKNKGGLITGAYIFPVYTDITIGVFNKKLGERSTYILTYDGLFEDIGINKSSYLYDIESKTFKFYIRESDKFDDFIYNLKLELEKAFPASKEDNWIERIEISYENKAEIVYINYKNIEFNQVYKIDSYDRLVLISSEKENNDAIFLGSASIEEDYKYIIQDICREIEESMTSKTGVPKNIRNPQYTNTNKNKEKALFDAKHYVSSSTLSYSRVKLIEILEEIGYVHEDAVYAVDNCGADWDKQALKTAKNYLLFEPYSYNKLLEVLTSIEKFPYEQAIYGVDNCEADWSYQAERRVQSYVYSNESCTYNELIKLLEDEGYTHEQSVYGIEQNGYTQ